MRTSLILRLAQIKVCSRLSDVVLLLFKTSTQLEKYASDDASVPLTMWSSHGSMIYQRDLWVVFRRAASRKSDAG